MNLFSEKNLPKLIIITPILTVSLVTFFVIYLFIKMQNDYFLEESNRLEEQYNKKQKEILKKELKNVLSYIRFQEKNTKLNEDELKKNILKYIESIRFGKDGYVWVHDTSYYLKAHPFRQKELNTLDINLKDAMDTLITKKFVDETIKKPNGVFIDYYWKKPKDVHFSNKLGFFLLYSKYKWVIGTGLYVTDIENSIYNNKKLLEKRIDKYISLVITISIFIIFIIGLISFIISQKIIKVLENYKFKVNQKELLLEDMNKNLELKVSLAIEDIQDKEKAMLHQSRLARMGTMLSLIAHQWRQPLSKISAILMELETAIKFKNSSDKLVISSVLEANNHLSYMSHTIDDFRNFFKPDKQKVLFHVLDACNEAHSLVEASFKSYCIDFDIVTSINPKINGYEREFSQVILNLLSNAKDILIQNEIKYPKITLNIKKENNSLFISVQDNAGGIKKEIFDYIFDPYFTTKNASKGTGLGLYITKMIIEKNMGGKIIAMNNDDGAMLLITLPLESISQ